MNKYGRVDIWIFLYKYYFLHWEAVDECRRLCYMSSTYLAGVLPSFPVAGTDKYIRDTFPANRKSLESYTLSALLYKVVNDL
jgi:hypothetical protein